MTNLNTAVPAAPARPNQGLKLALDLGPILVFVVTNMAFGIFAATAVLMVAVVASVAVSYVMTKRLPLMPIITVFAVLIFGGLTLYLHNDIFIKLKVTILNALFGAALLGGLAFGKLFLPKLLDTVLELDEAGWRKLTLRWGIFFLALAVVNEIVWRTQSNVTWGFFKGGIIPLTILFAFSQVPLILKHEIKPAPDKAEGV